MKRYIRSQYIPDMTERFPEGRDGIDLTDNYFPEDRYYESDEDAIWDAMEDDYMSALKERMEHWWSLSEEEIQNLSDRDKEQFEEDQLEWKEYDESEGETWQRHWNEGPVFNQKFDPEIMKQDGAIGSSDGRTVGLYGTFTYGGYWAQIGDDTNYSEAHFDTIEELIDYLDSKGYTILPDDQLPFV